jgi:hypothetical protein
MSAIISVPITPLDPTPCDQREAPPRDFTMTAHVRAVSHDNTQTRMLVDNGTIFQEFGIVGDAGHWIRENDRIEIEVAGGQTKLRLVSRPKQ